MVLLVGKVYNYFRGKIPQTFQDKSPLQKNPPPPPKEKFNFSNFLFKTEIKNMGWLTPPYAQVSLEASRGVATCIEFTVYHKSY